jgi:hypothetical protein
MSLCLQCNPRKRDINQPTNLPASAITSQIDHSYRPDCEKGQFFHMDFGFMRGSSFSEKDSDGKIITSMDGYNAYLLIIDRYSRYTWVFLTKGKHPPLDILKMFFHEHNRSDLVNKKISTDKRG